MSQWSCLWMVGKSCMTDHAVWTQHWSSPPPPPTTTTPKIDHDCGFYFVFLPDSQHQWFSHSLYVNMQQLSCICKCRWTSELTRSGMGAARGKLKETDYCCCVECFPYSCVSCTRSLKGAADILRAQNQTREKPFNWQENVSWCGFSVLLLNDEPIKVRVLHEGIQTVVGSGVKRYDLITTQINSKTMHVLLQ